MKEIKKGICPFCRLGCELGIVSEDWQIKGVEYLKGSGVNDGSLCPRGNAAAIYLDHPKRLAFPLLNGKEITWEEALTGITDILNKTDPHELAITYDSNLTEEEYFLVQELAQSLGVENVASSYLEPEFYFNYAIPGLPRASLEDIRNSSIFLLVGDVFNQVPVISRHILEAKYTNKKGRIYVIDSYTTHTASFADSFLQVVPGMEPLAIFALASRVSGQGKPHPDYIIASGVDSVTFEEVAKALSGNEKKAVIASMAFGRINDPLLLSGSIQHLTVQLPGEKAFLPLGESFSKVGNIEFGELLQKIESGEIKILINFGETFPHMYPQLDDKLRNLTYLVSTATLKLDIRGIPGLWLPTSLNLEKSGTLDTAFGVHETSPLAPPVSGAKSVGEIVERIALGLSLRLTKRKVAIPQKLLKLDMLKVKADRLAKEKKDDLVLVGEKLAYNFHSFFGEESQIKVNPVEAAKIGVKGGELVQLKTSQAERELKIVTTERVPPRMCVVPVESPDERALFELSIDEGMICFKPQVVELWSEKSLKKESLREE